MKAFILTEEEIEKLANGTATIEDLNLSEKQVKTWVVMPDFSMPTDAQRHESFDDAMMDKKTVTQKILKPKMIGGPYTVIVGKLIDRL